MNVGFLIWLGIIAIIVWLIWRDYKKTTTIYIDHRGYKRDGYARLVHRRIAYEIYKGGYRNGKYSERFGDYDVHHIDGNKQNNSPDNLQILTREEHKVKHGI